MTVISCVYLIRKNFRADKFSCTFGIEKFLVDLLLRISKTSLFTKSSFFQFLPFFQGLVISVVTFQNAKTVYQLQDPGFCNKNNINPTNNSLIIVGHCTISFSPLGTDLYYVVKIPAWIFIQNTSPHPYISLPETGQKYIGFRMFNRISTGSTKFPPDRQFSVEKPIL